MRGSTWSSSLSSLLEDLQGAVEITQEDLMSPKHWADFFLRLPSREPGIRINGGVLLVPASQHCNPPPATRSVVSSIKLDLSISQHSVLL